MIKRIFFILILLTSFLRVFPQKEAAYWYFGTKAGIHFTDSGVFALTDGKLMTDMSGAISDAAGNLLFYTDGRTVFNKEHKIMLNGSGLNCSGSGYGQYVIIVPWPQKNGFYFIFTTIIQSSIPYSSGLYYSIVDISQDSNRGSVVSKNNFLMANVGSKMNAIMHSNGKAIWLVTHLMGSDSFVSLLIDQNGINISKKFSKGNILLSTSSLSHDGYIKVAPSSDLLVHCTHRASNPGKFEICEFDNSSGIITDCITISLKLNERPMTSEFSPSGKLLYIGLDGSYNIYQYDVSVWDSSTIKNSEKIAGCNVPKVPNGGNYPRGMQVGLDGKIYVSTGYQAYLGVIQYPEQSGTSCNYVENYLFLEGGTTMFGLPNFIQSYFFKPEFKAEHTCLGDTTLFALTDTSHIDSLLWDFGDTNSATSNFSTQLKSSHVFSDTGIYNVQVFLWHSAGKKDTLQREIRISPYPKADFYIPDAIQCQSENVFYFRDTSSICSGKFDWTWDFGDSSVSYDQHPVHKYVKADSFNVSLSLLSDYGCEDKISKQVVVHPLPNTSISTDQYAQCLNQNQFQFFNPNDSLGLSTSKLWLFGD